jgi:isopenicillin N synthase-like dioxygenase
MSSIQADESAMFNGIEWVSTSPQTASVLAALLGEAHRFFASELDEKTALKASGMLTGWRSVGVEYSQSPERPDLNETFCYRTADDHLTATWTSELLNRCREAQVELDIVATQTLDRLARSLGVSTDVPSVRTGSESWLQLNFSRPATAIRKFIQDPHEDGHLVTFLFADANGLEVNSPAHSWTPILPTPNRLVCFPGECGALLTGDAIAPMAHQVRAHSDIPVRISMAYFVNPDLDQTLKPWVVNDRNRHADLLQWGQQNPTRFGLPAL